MSFDAYLAPTSPVLGVCRRQHDVVRPHPLTCFRKKSLKIYKHSPHHTSNHVLFTSMDSTLQLAATIFLLLASVVDQDKNSKICTIFSSLFQLLEFTMNMS